MIIKHGQEHAKAPASQHDMFNRRQSFAIAGLIGVVGLVQTLAANGSAESSYNLEYSGGNNCLHGTVFDPEQGAELKTEHIGDQQVLTVTPDGELTDTPQALHFTVTKHILRASDLQFADVSTGTYLSKNCGLTGGY